MLTSKKILVTGGAGFVGSNLCKALAKDNIVYSIDNYSTGSERNHVPNVYYISGHTKDINEEQMLDIIPDIIFHLGEYSRVEKSFDDIEKVLDYNKNGTQAVLDYALKHDCKLIYAGSSTRFADGGSNTSPYSWSKASNTELVRNYGDWFGLNYAITYFYNVYGPGEIETGEYATLIGRFKRIAERCEKIGVVLPGTQVRNFTHVDDIVSGLLLVGEFGQGDEYGIGSPERFAVAEVADMFKANFEGLESELLPPRRGNRMSAQLIDTETKRLGWRAERSLKDYINSLS